MRGRYVRHANVLVLLKLGNLDAVMVDGYGNQLRTLRSEGAAGEIVAGAFQRDAVARVEAISPASCWLRLRSEASGALPAAVQSYNHLTAAIPSNSKQPEAARALLQFLATPAAQNVMKAKGLEPG